MSDRTAMRMEPDEYSDGLGARSAERTGGPVLPAAADSAAASAASFTARTKV